MSRLVALLSLSLATVSISAAPVPKLPVDPTKDRDGNPLPKGATARLGSRPFHGKGLNGLAFSADGKLLMAFADVDHVSVWDTGTGKTLFAMPLKGGGGSNGEQTIASTIVNNRVIWITQSINLAAPDRINAKAVSTAHAFDLPDGSELARGRFTGRVNFDTLPHRTWSAAVGADGKYLAVALEKTKSVKVFEMATGKRLHTQTLTGVGNPGVYISPDSKTLYVSEYKKPLRRFELASGQELSEVAGTDDEVDMIAAISGWKATCYARMDQSQRRRRERTR